MTSIAPDPETAVPATANATASSTSPARSTKSAAVEVTIPQASVARIIRSILPPNVQVGKCAKQAFARAAGIFVLYATATANEFCKESKRQTVSAQDVLNAMQELDFVEFLEPLKLALEEYRKEQESKKQAKREKKAAALDESAKAQAQEASNAMEVDNAAADATA
jgi:DNA polymerase epsilon subunit 3